MVCGVLPRGVGVLPSCGVWVLPSCVWECSLVVWECSLVVFGCSLIVCGCSLVVFGVLPRCGVGVLPSCGVGVLPSCGAGASHHRASLLAERGIHGAEASVAVTRGLSSCGRPALEHRLLAMAQGLSCSAACGILPDQESDPCLRHRQADSSSQSHQGSPSSCDFKESTREAGWFSPVLFSCLAQCGPGFDW